MHNRSGDDKESTGEICLLACPCKAHASTRAGKYPIQTELFPEEGKSVLTIERLATVLGKTLALIQVVSNHTPFPLDLVRERNLQLLAFSLHIQSGVHTPKNALISIEHQVFCDPMKLSVTNIQCTYFLSVIDPLEV